MRAKSIGAAKSYRSGDATPGSLPADQYVTPTPASTLAVQGWIDIPSSGEQEPIDAVDQRARRFGRQDWQQDRKTTRLPDRLDVVVRNGVQALRSAPVFEVGDEGRDSDRRTPAVDQSASPS